jgi:hypothetical protein
MSQQIYTIENLRSLNPCYDPSRYLPENWEGTLMDILSIKDCWISDRIWAVLKLLPDQIAHDFGSWCARRAVSQGYEDCVIFVEP